MWVLSKELSCERLRIKTTNRFSVVTIPKPHVQSSLRTETASQLRLLYDGLWVVLILVCYFNTDIIEQYIQLRRRLIIFVLAVRICIDTLIMIHDTVLKMCLAMCAISLTSDWMTYFHTNLLKELRIFMKHHG